MCFGYLWITNQTGSQVLKYKKDRKNIPNLQAAYHKLFHIPKNAGFTLAELNGGYYDCLMDAISIEECFMDVNIIQYVFV